MWWNRLLIPDRRKPYHITIAPGHELTVMFADNAAHGSCSCDRFAWSTGPGEETIAMMVRAHSGLTPIDPEGRPPFTESTVGDDPYGCSPG